MSTKQDTTLLMCVACEERGDVAKKPLCYACLQKVLEKRGLVFSAKDVQS